MPSGTSMAVSSSSSLAVDVDAGFEEDGAGATEEDGNEVTCGAVDGVALDEVAEGTAGCLLLSPDRTVRCRFLELAGLPPLASSSTDDEEIDDDWEDVVFMIGC